MLLASFFLILTSCYLLLATYYLLLATFFLLLASSYLLFALCCFLFSTCYLNLLLATCYLLLATCYLFLATCYYLLATCYLLLATCNCYFRTATMFFMFFMFFKERILFFCSLKNAFLGKMFFILMKNGYFLTISVITQPYRDIWTKSEQYLSQKIIIWENPINPLIKTSKKRDPKQSSATIISLCFVELFKVAMMLCVLNTEIDLNSPNYQKL